MSHGRDQVRPGDERHRLQPPDGPEPREHREEEPRLPAPHFTLKIGLWNFDSGDSEQNRAATQVTPGF